MVPRPNYGSYKGIQSKHRKTHKGIKDQKSDSSESPLGDIRQKNMKELEYEEQSHIEHFGCPYFSPPAPNHLIVSMFTLLKMKWNDRLYFCQVDVFLKSGVKWIADGFSGLILFFSSWS